MNTVDLYANCKFFPSQKYITMACKLEELHYSSFSHVLIMTWNIYQGEKNVLSFHLTLENVFASSHSMR